MNTAQAYQANVTWHAVGVRSLAWPLTDVALGGALRLVFVKGAAGFLLDFLGGAFFHLLLALMIIEERSMKRVFVLGLARSSMRTRRWHLGCWRAPSFPKASEAAT